MPTSLTICRAETGTCGDCYEPAVSDPPSPRVRGRLRSVSRSEALRYAGGMLVIVNLAAAAMFDTTKASATGLAGMAVFLDPGHNGVYESSITRQVPNGRGGTKQCNTTGSSTDGGYSEHAFNRDVTLRIRDALTQMGVRTQVSRDNDNSVGPCVDQRAALPMRYIRTPSWAFTPTVDRPPVADFT